MLRALLWGVLCAVGATACGPTVESGSTETGGRGESHSGSTSSPSSTTSTSASSSSSGASSSSSGAPPPPAGCECTSAGLCGGTSVTCGGEELCPAIVTDCARPVSFYGCIGQEVFFDDAALTCALDALANRTAGWLRIRLLDEMYTSCGLEGCNYNDWRVSVLGEDAVVSRCDSVPMTDEDSIDILRPLETPGFFEACKDERTQGAQLDCLFEGLRTGTVLSCR